MSTDIISAAALMQTCFCTVGLGRGKRSKKRRKESCSDPYSFTDTTLFFSLVLLT